MLIDHPWCHWMMSNDGWSWGTYCELSFDKGWHGVVIKLGIQEFLRMCHRCETLNPSIRECFIHLLENEWKFRPPKYFHWFSSPFFILHLFCLLICFFVEFFFVKWKENNSRFVNYSRTMMQNLLMFIIDLIVPILCWQLKRPIMYHSNNFNWWPTQNTKGILPFHVGIFNGIFDNS